MLELTCNRAFEKRNLASIAVVSSSSDVVSEDPACWWLVFLAAKSWSSAMLTAA